MVTFNKFVLRKNAEGQLFLDLELNLVLAPQKTIMQMTFPASEGYQPQPQQPIIFDENSFFDSGESNGSNPINLQCLRVKLLKFTTSTIMNNEQKTPQGLPESPFLKAACKFFKCKSNKIKVRIISDGQEALVDYKGDQYIITIKAAILDNIEYKLSDINAALHLNIYVWIQATKNTISISKFLPTLVEKLNSPEEAYLLHLALSINSYTRDKYQTFWTTLAAIDKRGDILGKAIVSAREVYSGFGLLEDLTELTILNGKNDLNLLQDGIFETIEIDDDELPEFFIYSVTDYQIE